MNKITFFTLTALLLAPLTWAATKEEYCAASVKGLRELVATRAKGSVQHVLDGAKDKKIAVLGRGGDHVDFADVARGAAVE